MTYAGTKTSTQTDITNALVALYIALDGEHSRTAGAEANQPRAAANDTRADSSSSSALTGTTDLTNALVAVYVAVVER
jgi:hypothetical protein